MSLDDWQARVRSLTVGAGTAYEFSGPIGGLGFPKPRTHDFPRGDRTGEVGGKDTAPRRILTLPLEIDASSSAEIWPLRDALMTAWAESAIDAPLDLRLPGMTENRRFYGRTRGADVDLGSLKSGHADALCTYEALDPMGYGDEIVFEIEEGDGPVPIDNPGTAPSDRVSALLVGDGGRPFVSHGLGGFIRFLDTLDAGVELELGFRDRTVVDGDGVDRYPLIDNLSPWFRIRPGANTFELTGAASLEITYRPAFR